MKLVLVPLLLVGLVCGCTAYYSRTVSYQTDLLVKCSSLQGKVIQQLQEEVDVWRVGADGSVDFRVSREEFQRMKGDLPECREDRSIEDLVREMEKRHFNRTQQDGWFEAYHPYEASVEWYQKLAEDNPSLVKFIPTIGKSVEGRDMPVVRITASTEPDVKQIFFQCQIHAREWISNAVCMYIANELVERYTSGDEEVVNLLKAVEFVYITFVNPDGYEFSWTEERLWRKNRQVPPANSTCYGVDLNRNYDVHWGGNGSSKDPCAETYGGSGAASEPETQHAQNYFQSLTHIVGAIDWHSYSQLILRPYGYTTELPKDEVRLKAIGDQMAADIKEVHGKIYRSVRTSELFYGTGGASDWFYTDKANIYNEYRAAGYAMELRDEGEYGFELPPDQIIPNGQEIVPAVLTFAKELQANPLQK